jgi:quinol monooxygenase YgiN
MTNEYIRYLLVDHEPDALIAAYEAARAHLDAAPECLGYDLAQCDEEPNSLILRIEWTSASAHMQGFRRGPHFPPFLAAIRAFIPEIAEMRHYTPRIVSDG